MNPIQQDFTKLGFTKTFVLPALLVFLIPILSYAFFHHAQDRFDANTRAFVLQQISSDATLSPEKRAAATEYFTENSFSQLLVDDPEFAANVDGQMRFNYATFRWMIRLSVWSIVSGIAVFLLAGICAWLSLRSHYAQYLSLLVGWHVLRIYGALQTIAIGVLVIALSFWITALWFNVYYVKLIVLAGLFAVLGIALVIKAIFTTPKNDFAVGGNVLNRDDALPLWTELTAICQKVGTSPPDQIVAGIDDQFFVTEHPIMVSGQLHVGKTLFVSLPLLKQLHAAEADAILAHEMAHFSGQDTLYSKKISPLLMRFQTYLQSLQEGIITLPIFYFMLCFRILFELSLSKLSRQREFRADKIAAEITSPHDFAAALLRTCAYSKFRQAVESDLFKQEHALESADVSHRIASGFPAYAVAFAADPAVGLTETVHPFDTHPPTSHRLSAVGIELSVQEAQAWLASVGDGGWHNRISNAADLEQQQWQIYEEQFRTYHEQSLPYRFLPSTPEEQAVVEKSFPPVAFDSKEGTLSITFEQAQYTPWPDPIRYSEITRCALSDEGVLEIHFQRDKALRKSINTKKFSKELRQEVLGTFQNYYGRYLAAVEYQQQMKAAVEGPATSAAEPVQGGTPTTTGP